MAVNGHLPLLQCEGHHLHYVQDGSEVRHSVITPTEIVEINWKVGEISIRIERHFKYFRNSALKNILLFSMKISGL